MKLSIMQPYFLPYVGYFQLIAATDVFVVYDNIKYTKKGWINRNRLLQNGSDATFSLALKKDSDALDVVQRELSAEFYRSKLLNQFKGAYSRAPYFTQVWPLLQRIVSCEEQNLFRYIYNAIVEICAYLELGTQIRVSSQIDINHQLKGQDKVLALCEALGAETYINAIGGTELYDRQAFRAQGTELRFIRSHPLEYPQFGAPFVPWLSMVDVMMFNAPEQVRTIVNARYELL
ncbi:WbqC-like protein family protein [compost metagenome]